MERRNIIETTIGTLWGRDCIFLDRLALSNDATLVLEGTINTAIVKGFLAPTEMPASEELPYVLRFFQTLAFQVYELDTWQSQNKNSDDAFMGSSLEEVVNSEWVASLGGKVTPQCRHFSVLTYDDVIEAVSRDFELALNT